MYEHLVKNVIGRVKEGWLYLSYETSSDSIAHEKGAPTILVGAIETWLAQPKPPTPEERARGLACSILRQVHRMHPTSDGKAIGELEGEIAEAIKAAIEADRAARGDT